MTTNNLRAFLICRFIGKRIFVKSKWPCVGWWLLDKPKTQTMKEKTWKLGLMLKKKKKTSMQRTLLQISQDKIWEKNTCKAYIW